jgi:periplasmic protein TonB
MTLTAKNSPELNGPGKPGAPSQNSEGNAGQSPRSNPVCLEVNVTIRSLPGEAGGQAAPIREDGRTVIVFDNGAVLRSKNNLPAGQKVILSNAKGRDVVCQVVGGRNLPSVKGYVEVEFLEPVNDFWSIHQDAAPVVAAAPPAAPPAPWEAAPPAPPVFPATSRVSAPVDLPVKPASASLGSAATFEKVAGRASMPPAPAARDFKSEAARPGPERIAKAASDYNLSETAKPTSIANWDPPTPETPVEKHAIPAKREASTIAGPPAAPSHDFLSKGLMAYEQPDASTGASSGRMPLIVGVGALALAGACAVVFYLHRSTAPVPVANTASVNVPSKQEPAAARSALAPVPAPPEEAAATAAPIQMQAQPVAASSAKPVDSAEAVPAVVTGPATSDASTETRPDSFPDTRNARRQEKKAVAAKQPEVPSTRRPLIPNLKMASPSAPNQDLAKLNDGAAPVTDIASTGPVGTVPPAGLLTSAGRIANQPAPPPPALASANPPPAAPVVSAPAPVAAKTVREPKLISSVRPVYPATAKASNVQGIVTVSASIDANGKVVSAKALSGPILLRQPAADAVSQWKYSPGLTDGKPVPSQVTVSVEFRMN